MMATEQQDVSPATAGGAPAPDFTAIRDIVIDSLRAVPLWQFRQGLVAAGLVPADVEIQAADRKPVHGEPGIQAEWDEGTDAMRVDGIGWDLSWGCKVSFAYDPAKDEHYVCVATSDADQRAGITSRRTTKEQLASLGQQLLNVFGEGVRPEPRDVEIEQQRDEAREELDAVRHRLAIELNLKPSELDGRDTADLAVELADRRGKSIVHWKGLAERRGRQLDQRDKDERQLIAERGRLRQELDLAAEQHANGLAVLLEDFTAAVNGLMPKPAEPRRWKHGDPEPEIGTTVRQSGDWGAGPTWTSRQADDWHCNRGCLRSDVTECPELGRSWAWLSGHAKELVEVVGTDGE
jgi:hypothetical protein